MTTIERHKRQLGALVLSAVVGIGAVGCGGGGDDENGGASGSGAPVGNLPPEAVSRFRLELSDLPSGYTTRQGYPKSSSSALECLAGRTPESITAASQVQATGLRSCHARGVHQSGG